MPVQYEVMDLINKGHEPFVKYFTLLVKKFAMIIRSDY